MFRIGDAPACEDELRYGKNGLPENWEAVQCPVFAIGGWADSYRNFVLHMLQHLRVPRKGLIGPWLHDMPHVAYPGPQIDHLREMVRWWDYWFRADGRCW